jgi:hypothetical protein
METRTVRLSSFVAAILALPSLAAAQGIAIDHKPVGCIVAGKYPKMNACFAPMGNLSRSRVFFRAEGTPKWYFVEMKSDAPCLAGILPKPKKSLVKKKIEYYVQATDKNFAEGQTESYLPIVVASESECEKRLVAPFVTKAVVAVSPSMPAGFAGGAALSATTAVLGVAGAGAAAAGVVAATSNNDNTTTTTVGTTPPTAPPVTNPPNTTPPTQPPSGSNKPPNAVFRVNPNPPTGTSPFTVSFNMCGSSDPENDPLQFLFQFGDGIVEQGTACRFDHVYTATTIQVAAKHVYTARICVTDGREEHEQQCRTFSVDVAPPNPCLTDGTGPIVEVKGPATVFPKPQPYPIRFTASATDKSGVQSVTYKARGFRTGKVVTIGSSSAPPYEVDIADGLEAFNLFGCFDDFGDVFAEATDTCTNVSGSASVSYQFDNCGFGIAPPGPLATSPISWTSELEAPGAGGQIIMNGDSAVFSRAGRSSGSMERRPGENRLEAVLVEGHGPGTWRFEFAPGAIQAGSLRVVAGDVVLLTETAAVLRLRGQSGERIVLTFKPRD